MIVPSWYAAQEVCGGTKQRNDREYTDGTWSPGCVSVSSFQVPFAWRDAVINMGSPSWGKDWKKLKQRTVH